MATSFTLIIEEDLEPYKAGELLATLEETLNRAGFTIYDATTEEEEI